MSEEEFRILLRKVLRENYPLGQFPYQVEVIVDFIDLVEQKLKEQSE